MGGMSKKKRRARADDAREPRGEAPAPAPPRDVSGLVAAAALLIALVGTGLFVDSGADNSFEAPKRLIAILLIAAAAVAALGFSRWRLPRGLPGANPAARAAVACVLFAVAAASSSAFLSPRREPSSDALRVVLLYALLLPLGAGRVLEKWKKLLLAVFVAVAAVNAAVSFLQAKNLYKPFPLITPGSREATGAFVGNPGSLAFTLMFSTVACLGIVLFGRHRALRIAAAAGAAILVAGLLVNRNLTSLSAVVAGVGILLVARWRRRAVVPIVLLILLSGSLVLAYRPMRARAAEALWALRRGDWDHVVTYRLGAWSAAIGMTRDRPLLGYGPGTYGAEFVSHRLRAEIAARRRLVNPLATSSYAEAHCDYLQVFAEAGIPAGLVLLGAVFLLFRGLLLAARRLPEGPARSEAVCVLALLGAGGVAALSWFPLQRPISALPLLLAAGRGWRIGSGAPAGPQTPGAIRGGNLARAAGGGLLAVILAAAVAPEFSGYRSERWIRVGTEALRQVVTHPGDIADPHGALSRIEQIAVSAASALPGDSRPWILAGSTRLVAGEADKALGFYRHALSLGERAEIDINMGRAYEALGETAKSRAATLRALWISPALIRALLPDVAQEMVPELHRLEDLLREGKLAAPPPLPD
jgi:O-antigen ligase